MAEETLQTRPTFTPSHSTERPLSPHLQIWKFTVTMASSITHRATGIALYAGSVILTLLLLSAAISDSFYNSMMGLLTSPLGLIVLAGFTWSMMFHLVNGIKYLFWDAGKLLERKTALKVAWGVYILSVILTVLVWVLAYAMKG